MKQIMYWLKIYKTKKRQYMEPAEDEVDMELVKKYYRVLSKQFKEKKDLKLI